MQDQYDTIQRASQTTNALATHPNIPREEHGIELADTDNP